MITDAQGRPFIFDAFVRNDVLYLVSAYYHKDDPPVTIYVEGKKATEVGLNDGHESMRFFMTKVSALPTEITINGIHHPLSAYYYTAAPEEIAVATLFKDDHAYVLDTVRWYRTQGVTRFYLYYNGAELPEGLPQEDSVVYGLWPFPYRNYDGPRDVNRGWTHMAQPAFLTMVRLKYFPDHTWMGLIDLDEFVYPLPPAQRIADELGRTTAQVVMVKNHWSLRDGDHIQYSLRDSNGYMFRTKCFYSNKFRGFWGIHGPKTACSVDRTTAMLMAHVADYRYPDRRAEAKPPFGEFWIPSVKNPAAGGIGSDELAHDRVPEDEQNPAAS